MNRYLLKIAEQAERPVAEQAKHDLIHTGVIAGLGTLGNVATHRILNPGAPKGSNWKAAVVGGGIGLAADYAAVKMNNAISKKLEKKAMQNGWVGDPALVHMLNANVESRDIVDLTRKSGLLYSASRVMPVANPAKIENRY